MHLVNIFRFLITFNITTIFLNVLDSYHFYSLRVLCFDLFPEYSVNMSLIVEATARHS
jgi:hypothetical protein